ncbi:MAG: VWA domain-containing protein [Acidobacteriia bacterium]|nr:VWA domain-containing protein [Terriglobia bacterium]
MFLFNLSLAEFMALFSAASAVVVALYLLDRSRRSLKVATLRFWNEARRPVESTRRRRIRQWPSMLLQLAAIACLLLALAQLRWGSREDGSRDHVLILDTSAWMAAATPGVPGTRLPAAQLPTAQLPTVQLPTIQLMDQAKTNAIAYLRALPGPDRVMVVYADALATPATAFETDRKKLEEAIERAQPGQSAFDLRQALEFARQVQGRSGRRSGEIVYAGAGRMISEENVEAPPNLRVLPVEGKPDNVGLRKIGLRRSSSEADLWNIFVSVRNYGAREQNVEIGLQFGGAPAGSRAIRLAPGSETETAFALRTRAAGLLEARVRARGNALALDDRAVIELPKLEQLPVVVCSDEPGLLRPLLDAHPNVLATYRPTAQCGGGEDTGIVIYDSYVPSRQGKAHAIYLQPPPERSPAKVLSIIGNTAGNATVLKWRPDHPLSSGLRAQDLRLESAQVFAAGAQDVRIAEIEAGPVLLARPGSGPGQGKMAVLGFHPMRGALRYELTVPLLFANILRWMEPESFRRWELFAAGVGHVSVPVASGLDLAQVHVREEGGAELPFTVHGGALRFFSGKPGTVRVAAGDREQVHSLVLPEIPETVWEAPAGVRKGIPRRGTTVGGSHDLWQWLALAGALLLLVEWLWFSPSSVSGNHKVWLRSPSRDQPREPSPVRRAS